MLSRNLRTSVLWYLLNHCLFSCCHYQEKPFCSATGTRPIIKLLYKISSGTMINHKHIMTCKKMTPSASLQHRSGRYNHPTVNLFSSQQRYLHNDNSTTRNPQKYVSPGPIAFIQVLSLSSMLLLGRFCAPRVTVRL